MNRIDKMRRLLELRKEGIGKEERVRIVEQESNEVPIEDANELMDDDEPADLVAAFPEG